jgi:hypothetical protein
MRQIFKYPSSVRVAEDERPASLILIDAKQVGTRRRRRRRLPSSSQAVKEEEISMVKVESLAAVYDVPTRMRALQTSQRSLCELQQDHLRSPAIS